jgi:hypothetical protein
MNRQCNSRDKTIKFFFLLLMPSNFLVIQVLNVLITFTVTVANATLQSPSLDKFSIAMHVTE